MAEQGGDMHQFGRRILGERTGEDSRPKGRGTGRAERSGAHPWTHGNALLGIDPKLRRVWIAGQRLHHGVTGIAVLSAGLVGALAGRTDLRRAIGWTLAGSAMIAHDWRDRGVWFQLGDQSE